ncbi:MAG: SpoIID/LytB domain-containing protein [Ruminococcaceae bacterium]|nr:SpoIID/LytB domain-containing protein [Oscillospiraceae bacterium]
MKERIVRYTAGALVALLLFGGGATAVYAAETTGYEDDSTSISDNAADNDDANAARPDSVAPQSTADSGSSADSSAAPGADSAPVADSGLAADSTLEDDTPPAPPESTADSSAAEPAPPASDTAEVPVSDVAPGEAEAGAQALPEAEAAPATVEPGWVLDPATGRTAWQLATGSYAVGWFTHPATGQKHYLGADGLLVTGLFEAEGRRYYADGNGVVQTGLLKVDGVRYMAGEDGAFVTATTLEVNGKQRYAAADGAIVWKKGWFVRADGVKCYAYKDGVLKKGWLTSSKKRYWLDADGARKTDAYFKVSGKKYYANGSGVVATKASSVTRADGVKILVRADGVVKSGWLDYGGKRYRVDAEGVRATGYFKVSGKKYFAKSNGIVVRSRGWFTRSDKKKIYIHEGGVIKSGWLQVNGKTYHLNSEGERKTNEYFKVSGKTYYAKKDGTVPRTTGWFTRSDGKKVYARDKGVIKAGLITEGSKKYYLTEEGTRRSGFFQVGSKHYYAKSGVIKKGWVTVDGARYYVGSKGYLLTGRQTIDGAGYTFDAEGRLLSTDATMLTVTRGGKVVTDTAANILARVVMAEVGGFQDAETYKAQAVATHTYLRYQYSVGNKAPTVPDADPIPLVVSSVNAVAEQYLTYNGGQVLASYYASSNGKTNPSGDFWKTQYPYLVTVNSQYEKEGVVSNFKTTKTITTAKFREMMDDTYGAGKYSLQSDPAKWVQVTYNSAGYAKGNVTIGQQADGAYPRTPLVEYFYQNFVGIRSASFTVEYDSGKDALVFTSKGYGHGVGMSQWGAYLYSTKGGWGYSKILAHYYPGTVLVSN